MKTILITGANGFTGRYVADVFAAQNYHVVRHGFHNNPESDFTCDLTDKAAVCKMLDDVRPDGVIHLAALPFVGHDDPSAFYRVNVIGTLNVLEALAQAKITPDKVIVASSANVYGNPEVEVIDESTPPNPVNHYAASKLAMEFMVKTWFPRMPVILTRPFNYTGVGQNERFLVPKIVNHFRERKSRIELGNLDVARDFSDVQDIAKAYFLLYESACHSEIVNLCSGRVYTLKEIIDYMNTLADYQIEVSVNPAFVRDNEIKILRGSNDKLKALTGYRPEKELTDTLSRMYNA